jgi:hypothetical protein
MPCLSSKKIKLARDDSLIDEIMTPTFDSERYLYSFSLQERLSYKNCCLACDVRRCQGCSVG